MLKRKEELGDGESSKREEGSKNKSRVASPTKRSIQKSLLDVLLDSIDTGAKNMFKDKMEGCRDAIITI